MPRLISTLLTVSIPDGLSTDPSGTSNVPVRLNVTFMLQGSCVEKMLALLEALTLLRRLPHLIYTQLTSESYSLYGDLGVKSLVLLVLAEGLVRSVSLVGLP